MHSDVHGRDHNEMYIKTSKPLQTK